MASTTCSVCVEPFNRASRKAIECPHCKLECCATCASRYLETSGLTPQCMKCHRLWSHQYIRETFGASFVKKMADVRKTVLFNEQQALIPHTQEYVTIKARLAQLIDDEKAMVRDKFLTYEDRLNRSSEISHERFNLRVRLNLIENPANHNASAQTSVRRDRLAQSAPVYIKPCGSNACKGYVNAENHTCELCRTEYCSNCMEVKGADHRCKPEDVATASMLRKDTKGCPKCATPIHRISGCPDMFCVQCKTAFNWNSLKINDRGNSNPHYYEWLRENGGNIASRNTGCGDTPLSYIYNSNNFRSLTDQEKDGITTMIRVLHHYQNHNNIMKFYKDYRKTRQYSPSFQTVTLQARADYMTNKMTKEKFTQYLLRVNKAMEYNSNLDDIVRSIVLFRQHIIQQVVYATDFHIDTFTSESKRFVKYINDCVSHLEDVFYTKKNFEFIPMSLL